MATILARPSFFPSTSRISKSSFVKMATGGSSISMAATGKGRKLPILLFDVMDTLVRDPFYEDVPAFFRMPFKELLEMKHPTAWIEFENGLINESELAKKFFKDGRSFDLEGLKEVMRQGYSYIDGIEALLQSLKANNYEIHAFTNYPIWRGLTAEYGLTGSKDVPLNFLRDCWAPIAFRYTIIEDKLKLSKYLSWTFCSCTIGKRKPAAESYSHVSHHLAVESGSCIFIDDRVANVEAAVNAGMVGLHFKNAASLQRDLALLGIGTCSLSTN